MSHSYSPDFKHFLCQSHAASPFFPLLSTTYLPWIWLLSHCTWPYFQPFAATQCIWWDVWEAVFWVAFVFLRSPDYNEYEAVVCQADTEMGSPSLWCPCLHITSDPQDCIQWKAETWSLLIHTDLLLAEKRDGVISFSLLISCS